MNSEFAVDDIAFLAKAMNDTADLLIDFLCLQASEKTIALIQACKVWDQVRSNRTSLDALSGSAVYALLRSQYGLLNNTFSTLRLKPMLFASPDCYNAAMANEAIFLSRSLQHCRMEMQALAEIKKQLFRTS